LILLVYIATAAEGKMLTLANQVLIWLYVQKPKVVHGAGSLARTRVSNNKLKLLSPDTSCFPVCRPHCTASKQRCSSSRFASAPL
jgi:hypothetical protein